MCILNMAMPKDIFVEPSYHSGHPLVDMINSQDSSKITNAHINVSINQTDGAKVVELQLCFVSFVAPSGTALSKNVGSLLWRGRRIH